MKVCKGCGDIKPLADYPPDKRAKSGVQARCRSCINLWMKAHYRKNPVEGMLRRAASRARNKGWAFELTATDLLPLPIVCPVFGTMLRISEGPQDPNAYSLDRIDNKKGYVRGNVVVISYRANRLKNDGTANEHEIIARWMRAAPVRR